jgi:hypothetical protein
MKKLEFRKLNLIELSSVTGGNQDATVFDQEKDYYLDDSVIEDHDPPPTKPLFDPFDVPIIIQPCDAV